MVASNEGRVGVLGSAFNPPHVGHMLLAQEARWQLGLGRVLLMTTGRPPHKEIADDPGAELRLEMAATAAAEEEWLEASPLEVERDETSYSYRTLELLRKRDPEAELWFLLGADMAAGLESWERPRAGCWSLRAWRWCRGPGSRWTRSARRWSGSVPPLEPRYSRCHGAGSHPP